MITRIEALRFRCLRYINQELEPFHVLVGPNASGKTTFLDVVAFLGELVDEGLDKALRERSDDFRDLVWMRQSDSFELAIEAAIPDDRRRLMAAKIQRFDTIRYEVKIGVEPQSDKVEILAEKGLLKAKTESPVQLDLNFPSQQRVPLTLMSGSGGKSSRTVLNKTHNGTDKFYTEANDKPGQGWFPSIKLGPFKSALGNLPYDESSFPATTWFRDLLVQGVQQIVLNSLVIRRASAPGQGKRFLPNGSNLPWVIEELRKTAPDRFKSWIAHIQTALPDIEDIRTVEREDDRHRYLVVCYRNGVEVPSWTVSDGTLRLLALTLPAYLMSFKGLYLIEEPENGIHPRAVEPMFQSLSSAYDAQILMATHSPVILNLAKSQQVLCFAKTPDGATDIVRGDNHPLLREWQGETSLGTLFAAGVLG